MRDDNRDSLKAAVGVLACSEFKVDLGHFSGKRGLPNPSHQPQCRTRKDHWKFAIRCPRPGCQWSCERSLWFRKPGEIWHAPDQENPDPICKRFWLELILSFVIRHLHQDTKLV